jgi:hypothetical protein
MPSYCALSGLNGLRSTFTQGVALGCFIAPLRGYGFRSTFTQGVALGYSIAPLRGYGFRCTFTQGVALGYSNAPLRGYGAASAVGPAVARSRRDHLRLAKAKHAQRSNLGKRISTGQNRF